MSDLLIPGMNVHNRHRDGRGWSAEETAAHFAYIEQLQPSSMLYLDNLDWARRCKKLLPDCRVIHRRYFRHDIGGGAFLDEGSIWLHKNFAGKSTQDWLYDQIAPDGDGGVIVHVLNEPNGYGDLPRLVEWLVPLCEKLKKAGIRFVAPNWGVGHPSDQRFDELAPLLDAVDDYGIHEYWSYKGLEYGNGRVGRFEWLVNYLTSAGKAVPDMLVTEFGIDAIDTSGKRGWRDSHADREEEYADEGEEALVKYRAKKCIKGVTYFSEGATSSDWHSHDTHGARLFRDKLLKRAIILRQGGANPPPLPEPPLPAQKPAITDERWQDYIARVPGNVVTRVRREPWVTAPILTSIPVGVNFGLKHIPQEKLTPAEVAYANNDPKGFWQIVLIGDHIGYMRSDVVSLTPDVIVPPPKPPETPPAPPTTPVDTVTRAQVELLIDIALNVERTHTRKLIEDTIAAFRAEMATAYAGKVETQAVKVVKAG